MTDLTCWPKGFLERDEAEAAVSCFELVATEHGELTVEDEAALEKLRAALTATREEAA